MNVRATCQPAWRLGIALLVALFVAATGAAATEWRATRGTGDLGLIWYLHSMDHRHAITLKARMPRDDARVPSVSSVWPTAAPSRSVRLPT